jgi:hypothetical protein
MCPMHSVQHRTGALGSSALIERKLVNRSRQPPKLISLCQCLIRSANYSRRPNLMQHGQLSSRVEYRLYRRMPRIAQTPLIRFVVDLLYNLLYSKSTTSRTTTIYNISTCQDVVDSLWTRQQIHNKSKQWEFGF